MPTWDSDIQSYLSAIAKWPVLPPDETTRLAEAIAGATDDFRRAMARVPGTALSIVERWQARSDQMLVTGMMCHLARDDRKTNWSAHIDRVAARLRSELARGPGAADKLAALVTEADILFEILEEVHTELSELARSRSQRSIERAARLGLKGPESRRAMRDAGLARRKRDDAKQHFARSNLRLVVARAKRFRSMGVRFEDLIQEGNLGLLRAIDKFEPDRGYRFSTYAVWWIDQALIRSIQNQSRTIRVPSHMYDRLRALRQAESRVQATTGGPPSREGIARELGIGLDELEELSNSSRPIRSIDEPVGDEGARSLIDLLPDPNPSRPEDTVHEQRVSRAVNRSLESLTPRDRRVLSLRYGLEGSPPLSLREIGRQLGVTGERIRQIEIGALSALAERDEISSLREPGDRGDEPLEQRDSA